MLSNMPSLARGMILSLFAAFFAAAYLIPYRYAVDRAPHFAVMTAMFLVAVVLNGILTIARSKRRPIHLNREAILTALALAVCTIIGNLAVARALPDIGTGMTSMVLKAQVILTPLMVWWVLGERSSHRLWWGALVALSGVVVPHIIDNTKGGAMGYIWALLAATAFASMQIVTRRVIMRIQSASVNMVRLGMAVLALQLLPEGREAWSLPLPVWGAAAVAGLFGPVLSRLCLMLALKDLSPSVTALIALIGPVFAFGLGFIFFGETPGPLELLGALLILAGILWAILPSLRDVFGFSPNHSRREVQSG